MPNYIKQIGIQADPTRAASMYDVNSDIATFITIATNRVGTALDGEFKYNIVEWAQRSSTSDALLIEIPALQANQEIYAFFINPYDTAMHLALVHPTAPAGNKTYFTGDVEKVSDGSASAEFTVQPNSTMEISVIRLDKVSGSTTTPYYFVRVG